MKIPDREDVKAAYTKEEIAIEINKYYEHKKALIAFCWHLMNQAWTDGYTDKHREND